MELNHKLLDRLIAHLESIQDNKFDIRFLMRDVETGEYVSGYTHCKTAGCIAGWINFLAAPEDVHMLAAYDAALSLGIDHRRADALFLPHGHILYHEKFTRKRAISCLKRLKRTGKVRWGFRPGGPGTGLI